MNKNNLKKQNSDFKINYNNVDEKKLRKSCEYNSNSGINKIQASTESIKILDLVKNYLNSQIIPESIKKLGKN